MNFKDESFKAFKNQSNFELFPTPTGDIPKINEVYRTGAPKEIIVEGIASDQNERSEIKAGERQCPLDSRFISVTPKDVLILAQFINKDGSLRSQKQTGLSDRLLFSCSH